MISAVVWSMMRALRGRSATGRVQLRDTQMEDTGDVNRANVLRRAVLIVALLNLGYFFVEFVMARRLGAVSLFADSVDFLEDAAINFLVFFALAWTVRTRARVGHVLAVIIVVPAAATLWTAIVKIFDPTPPDVVPLSVTALGALAVNLVCAALLVRHRSASGSLARGAWLAARNDSLANVLVLAAALVTLVWSSGWPDIIAGLVIVSVNADAAVKVWKLASQERLAARATPQP